MRTSLRSTLALLLTGLLVAACGDDAPKDPPEAQDTNQPPVVSLTSPAGGTAVREDAKLTLAASATDAEDGDLSAAITWSSSRDGALSPDAEGKVSLTVGAHTLTASATDSKGRKGSASADVTVTALPAATHVVSAGRRLHLYAVTDTELIERAVAEIPAAGTLAGHQIFNVLQHPTQPWLYAVSTNECYVGDFWCWGNGRIDRFVVTGTSLVFAGSAFIADLSVTDMPCAQATSEYEGQTGYCAPVGMAFNADGSRLFIQDDQEDAVQTFAIDSTSGAATYLELGAGTGLHGLALHPNGQYLYNGTNVFSLAGDTTANLRSGSGGNATQLFDVQGAPTLLTTLGTSRLGVYALTDPAAPAELSALSISGSSTVRDLAIDASGSRIVAVGRNAVSTVAFAEGALTLEQTLVLTGELDIENRGVALAAGGTRAVVSWFTVTDPDEGVSVRKGGVSVYAIGAAGELTAQHALDLEEEARVVRALRLP